MVLLNFSCYNLHGEYQECSFGGDDVEACFDVLSELVAYGLRLISVRLSEYPHSPLSLPVDAFDGEPMHRPLKLLQSEWEAILGQR
ncbi:hypothetical protein SAMN05216167_12196 [Spirosoma endophyticum]|uniref:Uncharacterized protein n=1 Tax=Spirosoma endophyticum TaxID=662367 RepID=A0A1I2EBM2_9BACT|nr:hypothetical protein SAMN05216167_12196 [Spirosoma endophyticum]